MALRAAMAHPLALVLLLASIMLAGGTMVVPALYPWAGRAGWIIAWGVAIYVGAVVVAYRVRPGPSARELRELATIRQLISRRLAERAALEGDRAPSVLSEVLADAVRYIDDQLEPSLSELLRRQTRLSHYLAQCDRGKVPSPGPTVLERLRSAHARQRAAIEQCIEEGANAAATLVVILEEGDDTIVAARARTWSQDLLQLHDVLASVLRDEDPTPPLPELEPLSRPEAVSTLAQQNLSAPPHLTTNGNGAGYSPEAFVRILEEALRRLNNLAALANCEVLGALPCTLAAQARIEGNRVVGTSSPLQQAQALREVIVAAIERLKPPDMGIGSDTATQAMQYRIIHDEYVRGLSTKQLLVRHSISESGFHRHRREAVEVLARELITREKLLCGGDDGRGRVSTLIDYLG